MNALMHTKKTIIALLKVSLGIDDAALKDVDIKLNLNKARTFGDLSCNAAMVLSKILGKSPRVIAQQVEHALRVANDLNDFIEDVTIAGPGFINITLKPLVWQAIARELLEKKDAYFSHDETEQAERYLIEFVSANPTGPLHLGHGRGGIIGDVLARVLEFLGHNVAKEFYINDAGNQIGILGRSFQVRCLQALGMEENLPEGGYQGEYLSELAKVCVALYGKDLINKEELFFATYAKKHLLGNITNDLQTYGIVFDTWFSEKELHDNGAVDNALEMLQKNGLAYEHDGALWFRSTEFGDDKDRVIRKTTGEMTYIAGDIAYHKNKFDRGYDHLIDIMGQDHHGYVKRLKATMEALGYDAKKLDVILYQLVTIKHGDEAVRMSKRAGTFTTLKDIIETVGTDVARFFYLNRKADAHLEFDLSAALKKTDENPVFYIQYAYVRTGSIITKAKEIDACQRLLEKNETDIDTIFMRMSSAEYDLLAKMISLRDVLRTIAASYQTHMLAYYSWELASAFHTYYAQHRVVDPDNVETTKLRLVMVMLVRQTLDCCLRLLGISRPEKM